MFTNEWLIANSFLGKWTAIATFSGYRCKLSCLKFSLSWIIYLFWVSNFFSLCEVEFCWSKMCPGHAVILLSIFSFISLINQGQSAGSSEMKNFEASFNWDSRGYVFYCPCMGKWIFRCGNYYVYPPCMCTFSIPFFEHFLWYWQGEFNSPEFLVF